MHPIDWNQPTLFERTFDFRADPKTALYLLRDSNDLLRPKLEKSLHAGARIVSHDYEIRGWRPTAVEHIEASKRQHKIYVYTVPMSFAKK